MKKTAFCFTALAFLSLLAFSQEEGYDSDSFARLTYVKGHVVVQRAQDLGSEEGVVNLALVEGDQLETGDGRAELSFGRKNFLRLDGGTLVELSNMPREGDNRVRIHLLKGTIFLRLNFLSEEKSFELHTPDASFYALEAGLFRFDMKASGETELSVIEGSMEAAGEGGSLLIASRERLVASGGILGSRMTLTYGRDDFDLWNADRDGLYSRYVPKRYLSSELEDYEYELAENGNWVYERPYGYVWVPQIYINDWRPYYYGRWAWYPVCGWTWVPYESWGWCTYHYGRWHWRLGLGWYWIPHHTWGPGWVHWYWGHDYCGWAPLSWYNRPVVIVNNYFYDRWHRPQYPGGSRALTVVHKSQLQNRRISDVALSRTEASRLGNLSLQARQPAVKPTLRSPGLQRAVPAGSQVARPQIRPSSLSRSQEASPASPGARISGSSAGRNARTVTGERPSASGARVSPGSLSRNQSRSVSTSPASPSTRNKASITPRSPRPGPASSLSNSERRIRSDSSAKKGSVSSSSPPAVRSYSSSPRVSTGRQASSAVRENSPRTYAPDARISRFGSTSVPSSSRSQSIGGSRVRGSSPSSSSRSSSPSISSRPSSSLSRGESYSRLRSFSGSSSRSIFSSPKSSSSSRSPRSSSPSISRSSPRASSGSRSAPSRSSSSSSSRGSSSSRSSGSVRKKN